MKKVLFLSALMGLFLFSCQENKTVEQTTTAAETTTAPETKDVAEDAHSSMNALDWKGFYYGMIPCDGCPGTNVFIRLKDDNTFEKTTETLKDGAVVESSTGTFSWTKGNNAISLDGKTFMVGENQLVMTDADGKVITGDNAEDYLLQRVEIHYYYETDNSEYHLQKVFGDDQKEYAIHFITATKTPLALLRHGQMAKVFFQQEASAKTALYKGENASLETTNGKTINLQMGDKKIVLTVLK